MCDKRVLLAVGAVLAVAGVYAAGTLWRASRALRTSAVEIEREGRIPFTSTALDPRVPAGFESLPIPPGFRDAIIFGDHIFIAGGGGLFEYDASGVEVARFRTGLELPATRWCRWSLWISKRPSLRSSRPRVRPAQVSKA